MKLPERINSNDRFSLAESSENMLKKQKPAASESELQVPVQRVDAKKLGETALNKFAKNWGDENEGAFGQ